MELARFVVCPETLGPLEPVDGGFRSERTEHLYPVRRGIVFMGFPSRDRHMIEATMEEEREWQGTGAAAEANLSFLRGSAPRAVDLINLIRRYLPPQEGQRALELGCGNGWASWLLAEAGFDTWLCDFEANSLATGLNLEHPLLGEGKRFAVDARYAPFADGCMDLVLLKEFVHHVSDYRSLFNEANRILRPGGLLVLLEPTRSVRSTLRELRWPETRLGHHLTWPDAYLRALRGRGFQSLHEGFVYEPDYFGRPAMRALSAWADKAVDDSHPFGNWFTKAHARLLGGGSLEVVTQKQTETDPLPRPSMTQIDPSTLRIDEDELAAYDGFPEVLREAGRRLHSHPPATVPPGAADQE